MRSKWGLKGQRTEKVDKQRRTLLKLAAAGGASAIASPWTFQSSRAASKTIKIGMITPETGPIAAFGEPSKWVAAGVQKALGGRHYRRRPEVRCRDHQQGQPVESQPRFGSGCPTHQQRQSGYHDRVVDVRHGQSGIRPMRTRRRALRDLRRSVAGLVLPAQGRPEERLRVDLPLLLGLRHARQRVRRHVAVDADQQGRRHNVDQRSGRQRRQRRKTWDCRRCSSPRASRSTISASIRRCRTTSRRRFRN